MPDPAGAAADRAADRAAELAALVVAGLTGRGQTLATAESLTGGLLAAAVVAVPGASAAFRGGLVVYATDLKETLAGVPAALLAARGAVDAEVAVALAAGARQRCRADWGLATTGVAGPDAPDGVPVGTVFAALAGTAGDQVWSSRLSGDRAAIRAATVVAALELLVTQLADGAGGAGTRPA